MCTPVWRQLCKHHINCHYFHLKDERTEGYRDEAFIQGCRGITVDWLLAALPSLWPHDLTHFSCYSSCTSGKLYNHVSVFIFLLLFNLIIRYTYLNRVSRCVLALSSEILKQIESNWWHYPWVGHKHEISSSEAFFINQEMKVSYLAYYG